MVASSAVGETPELTLASLLGALAVGSELDVCGVSVAWGSGSPELSASGAAVEVPDVVVSGEFDDVEVFVVTGPGCVGTVDVAAGPGELDGEEELDADEVSRAVVVAVLLGLLDPAAGVPSAEQPQSSDNTGAHLPNQVRKAEPLFWMGL